MLVVASRATWEWTPLTKKQSELLLTKKAIKILNNCTIFTATRYDDLWKKKKVISFELTLLLFIIRHIINYNKIMIKII